MRILLLFFIFLFPFILVGQEKPQTQFAKKLESYKIQPVAMMQLWSTYTIGTEILNGTGLPDPVSNRFNSELHRSRIGFKGQPYENFKFALVGAYDFVGRDVLAGTVGGNNNGANPFIRLWLAKIEWRLSKNDAFNLTTGYFATVVGRESNTAPTRVTSMEKAWSQNYLRRHIVGTGPGRSPGINLGGVVVNESKFKLQYDVGIHSPQFVSYNGNSAGNVTSPLWAGKLTFDIGQPRGAGYSMGYKSNYFGKRNGATIAFSGSYQGATDLYKENSAYGVEFGLHYDIFNIDGEYHLLNRKGTDVFSNPEQEIESDAAVWFTRATVNINLKNGHVLVPYAMAVQFAGPKTQQGKDEANLMRAFTGNDDEFSIGVEYNFNMDFKLTANYTLRGGVQAGDDEAGTFNNYYRQGGVGDFKRGDWVGLGLVVGL